MSIVPIARYFKPSIKISMGVPPTPAEVLAGIPDPVNLTNAGGVGLHIAFSIEKSLRSTPDRAVFQAYNLDSKRLIAASVQVANLGRYPVGISIGYDSFVGQIFSGNIRKMTTRVRSGPDVISKFEADDGGEAIQEVPIAVSIAVSTAQALITAAIAAFATKGIVIAMHPSVAEVIALAGPRATAPFHLAHIGKASDLLDQAALILSARWYIQGGFLFMAALSLPTDKVAVNILDTHLLGEIEEAEAGFVRIPTFCDPNIFPGRQLVVATKQRAGIYRVDKTVHSGDTRGSSPWMCNALCRSIG